MSWSDITALGLSLLDNAKAVIAAPSFWGALIPISFLVRFILWRGRGREATVSLPGFGSVTLDLTDADRALAWKLHVQLVTRKAALPFDSDGDIVVEVFSSLFELFSSTREMLLELPPRDRADGDSVANLAIKVLNATVRPRLTRWNAEYRRWWERAQAAPDNSSRTPQEIQRDFPHFASLLEDIRAMNTELAQFAEELEAIAAGRKVRKQKKKLRAAAPSDKAVAPVQAESLPPVKEA